ncbi:MAG: hypothetical protein QXU09_02410 [Thermoproteota archaeon]
MNAVLEQLLAKARELAQNSELVRKIEEGKNNLKTFLKKYPFRERPDLIDDLTSERIYNPGSDDYFFLWMEHKTRNLGAIFTYGGNIYPNAIERIDQFKQLLKVLVDESKTIKEKIDYDCGIKGFGGDKLIAKKILYCYFSNELLPIFKTDDLERFCRKLNIDFERDATITYNKPYEDLTVGKKYELLNKALLGFKNQHFQDLDNPLFTRLLYEAFPNEERTKTVQTKPFQPLYKIGLLFEPQTEQEVVYLFSRLHRELGFPYIIKFQESFPDIVVLDENRELKRIEIEKFASDFINHKHPPEECDFIICWENDLTEIPEEFPQIISLKDYISEYEG